jgi:hypothetical protein
MSTNFITSQTFLTLGSMCLLATSAVAQGRVGEFLGVQSWHGTVTISAPFTIGTTSGGGFKDDWSADIASTFTFQLPTEVPLSQSWTGTFRGSSNLDSEDTTSFGTCSQAIELSYLGPLGAGKAFTLHLQGPNQYQFFPSDYVVAGAKSNVFDCFGGDTESTGTTSWAPAFGTVLHDLPATGFSLKGAQVMNWSIPVQPFSVPFGGQPTVVPVLVSWDLEPGLLPPQILVTKTLTRDLATSDILVNVTVANNGGVAAENTLITTARIGSTNSTSLPLFLGTIDPGDTATGVLHFPPSAGIAGTPAALTIGGTYLIGGTDHGSFSGASKVTLP